MINHIHYNNINKILCTLKLINTLKMQPIKFKATLELCNPSFVVGYTVLHTIN